MKVTNARWGEANDTSRKIIDEIGEKLPKKIRKKIGWKKIAPVLKIVLIIFVRLSESLFQQNQPTAQRGNRSHPPANPASRQTLVSVETVQDDTLQRYIFQAEAYQVEIEALAQNATHSATQGRNQEMADQVQVWVASIIALARRIDNFRQNRLINKELKEVPKSIASLEARLKDKPNQLVAVELERTLANRRHQMASLEKLQQSIDMAEVKIENTISMLGIIYSQILAGQSMREVSDYRRLLTEVNEEVHTLQDYLAALEEVKLGQT